MNSFLALPIILPLLCAIVSIFGRHHLPFQRGLSVIGCAANLLLSLLLLSAVYQNGILVLQVGNWAAPFGISLVADLFSTIMLIMSGLMGTAVAVYSIVTIDEARERHNYHVYFHILLMGVNGAFLTGDLFNLYVWFEVMLMASFVLLALGGERPQLEGAIKYFALNFLSSALFLAAVGILYGLAGTLNMADLARIVRETDQTGIINTVSMLFLVAFGIKAAVFPLFFWLPASYHTPPSPVSTIFAGLLTKVGVYALIRVFTLIFVQDEQFTHTIILIIAGFTMVTGVLGAAAQMEVRRILAFHIVSQIGYMIMGLGLVSTLALAGSIFYIAHNIIAKANLFLVAGIISYRTGTNELKKLGGFYNSHPWLAVLFLISAMALAGLPPLSGFFAKLTLVLSGLSTANYLITGIALAVGLLTLFSMTKIWNEVFWKPAPDGAALPLKTLSRRETICLYGPVVVLALCTVALGLCSGWVLELALMTGEQLHNPSEYIHAVLTGVDTP